MKTPNLLSFILLSFFVIVACSGEQESVNDNAQSAPSFSLQTLEGKTLTLEDYKGKVLLLNIWDTWCPPCIMEIPHFIEIYDEYEKEGFEILGVAVARDGRDAVEKFVKDHKINYPIAYATQELFNTYGPISGIPTSFLIDKKGRIVEKYIGMPGQNPNAVKQVLSDEIKPLL
jgi:peroxiredoxin